MCQLMEQRIWKRALHEEYKKPKYDSAFILNAMSDHEVDEDGAGFVLHSQGYRSETVSGHPSVSTWHLLIVVIFRLAVYMPLLMSSRIPVWTWSI
jgi:hypothetical protein